MQKVAIVNGTAELLDLINGVLGAGHYDAVFIESSAHAYSQVRRHTPAWSSSVSACDDLERLSGAVDAQDGRGHESDSGTDLHQIRE